MAVRAPRWGKYTDYTWNEYRRHSDQLAAALIHSGIEPGDRIAVLSENRYEWLVADQGVFSAGAVTVPLHTSLSGEQIVWQLNHSEARWLFISGKTQWDKFKHLTEELPFVDGIVFLDSTNVGASIPVGWNSHSWQSFLAMGRDALAEKTVLVTSREAAVGPDCLATIIYTSGTTGEPKGVMLTHGNLVSNAVNRQKVASYRCSDIKLSWLPYSHAYARTVDCYMSAYVGMTVVLARSPQTLRDDLLRAEPTWMTGVPRFYEKIWRELKPLSLRERRRRLPAIFGRRIRALSCGGAPIDPEIVAGFHEAGLPIHVGYGLTETSPVLTLNTETATRLGTVGQGIPEVELRISPAGEVLTRGPHVMAGYWKDPDASVQAIRDGWLHTGDLGSLDGDGYLSIHGRIKDLIITSQGKNIAPIPIEQRLMSDPAIEQAVLYGDERPFLSALIVPDFAWFASEFDCSPAAEGGEDGRRIWMDSRVTKVLAERIPHCLRGLGDSEQVRKFVILNRPFSVADGEMTPSLKLRRQAIIDRYRAELDGLYL